MQSVMVTKGVYWVAIPEAGLSILCGCPADSVKLLMRKGLIVGTSWNGVAFETGPNAILLSDISTQNETFANLSEFPVLQMLYRQGMMVPGHPGNTGQKPLLIGLESQVRSQSQYIFRGNYGLASLEEIKTAGVDDAAARDYMRMKLWFAFGRIRQTDEMLEMKFVADAPVPLRGGAAVRRTGFNRYEFSCRGETAEVDLNLRRGEWNDVEGLQVKPEISAHPVETNVFHFRTLGEGGYRTYAHLADVTTFEVLHKMAAAPADAPGVSRAFAERLEKEPPSTGRPRTSGTIPRGA
jgi:hypothetical protein